jgi:radical SAM protein with 4Fe4S-binding SPASM domain
MLKKQESIKKEYRACTEVYQKMGINWDGKVTACCADYDEFLLVGDLADSSISDIWQNSEELKAIRLLLDKMKHWSLNLCSRCYQTYDEF